MGSEDQSDNIEKLYKNFGILADAKENISKHEKEYLEILAAVKGSTKEKRLASQFIARFFKNFPNLSEQALEAQLDLCEDEDVSIRKQAIKDLPTICKDNREQIAKIADVLAQLLQADDQSELVAVYESLLAMLKIDVKGTLSGIFAQILTGDESIREQCIKFITKKIMPLDRTIIDKSAEDLIINESKKVLQDVTGDEFVQLMQVLTGTKLGQDLAGSRELVHIISEQAELNHPFDPRDESQIDRIIHCTHCALPFFSAQVDSNKFVKFLCEQVLSQLDDIPAEISNFQFLHLELLRIYADCTAHCRKLPDAASIVLKTLNVLLRYLPLPPPPDESMEKSDFEFSHIEAAIYALHKLGKICSEPITTDPERYRDFKLRLQYLGCNVQGYVKGIRADLPVVSTTDLKDEKNKLKLITLKTTSNISVIIKDLFQVPPRFQSTIIPSWKPASNLTSPSKPQSREVETTKENASKRRHSSSYTDYSDNSKQHRGGGREIYHPPSGKFSDRVSGYGSKGVAGSWSRSRNRPRGNPRWRY